MSVWMAWFSNIGADGSTLPNVFSKNCEFFFSFFSSKWDISLNVSSSKNLLHGSIKRASMSICFTVMHPSWWMGLWIPSHLGHPSKPSNAKWIEESEIPYHRRDLGSSFLSLEFIFIKNILREKLLCLHQNKRCLVWQEKCDRIQIAVKPSFILWNVKLTLLLFYRRYILTYLKCSSLEFLTIKHF